MIAVEEADASRHRMARAMREGKLRQGEFERAQRAFVRDPAERDQDRKSRQCRDRRRQIAATRSDFLWRRLVLRRNTTHRVDDRAVDEGQAVIRPAIVDARGEAELDERRIKKVARVVAREGPSRPVGPAQSRRKSDDRYARVRFAKGWNRRVPPVRERGPIRGPEGRESRTIRTVVRRADVER